MIASSTSALAAVVAFLALGSDVVAHSKLSKPASRANEICRIGGPEKFGGHNCPGPCELSKDARGTGRKTIWRRGDDYRVEWPRNNHSGGFTRLAIVPHADSDSFRAFDDNVFHYSCYEFGENCHGSCYDPNDKRSPKYTDCSDGGVGGKTPSCYTDIKIPTHLPNGLYTLQWTWYGALGGFVAQYFSCADIQITGGVEVTPRRPVTFKLSDKAYPDEEVCAFSQTNRLYDAWSEPAFRVHNSSWPFPMRTAQKGRPHMPELSGNPGGNTGDNSDDGDDGDNTEGDNVGSGGTPISLKAVHSSKCVDIASDDIGATVQQKDCTAGASQKWAMSGSKGIFMFKNMQTDLCLDVHNASSEVGAQLKQFRCHGRNNQKFEIFDARSGKRQSRIRPGRKILIRSVSSSLYMDVSSSSIVHQWRLHGRENQQFEIMMEAGVRSNLVEFDETSTLDTPSSGNATLIIGIAMGGVVAVGALAAVAVGMIVLNRKRSASSRSKQATSESEISL